MNPLLANIILDYFEKGGPIMWPILLAFLAGVAVVLQRGLWWLDLRRRLHSDVLRETFDAIAAGKFEEAAELTALEADPFLSTVHVGLVHAHSSLLGAMQLRASDEIE